MKTYFKSGSVDLMIDSDNSKVVLTHFTDDLKIINVVTGADSYNRIVENSTDTNIWTISTEETFNSALTQVTENF
jgi:hypothetical protein